MKKSFITALLIGATTLGFAQNTPTPMAPAPAPAVAQEPTSTLKFEKTTYDFGQVIEGEMAKYDFKFTNTGNEAVLLSNVQASCGCTTPQWPKDPIAAGAASAVTALYNSAGRPGYFTKTITVTTSNAGIYYLTITGTVVPKQEKPKSPVVVE